MEDTTMIKKEYQKPTMQVIKTDMKSQILAGSVTGIQTIGLDDEEEIKFDNDDGNSGSIWDDAW